MDLKELFTRVLGEVCIDLGDAGGNTTKIFFILHHHILAYRRKQQLNLGTRALGEYGLLMPSFSFVTILSTYHLNLSLFLCIQDELVHRRVKKKKIQRKKHSLTSEPQSLYFIPQPSFPSSLVTVSAGTFFL